MPHYSEKSSEETERTEENEQTEEKLVLQIENEYQVAWQHMQAKHNEWLRRLKLFNNQARDKSKVGDPLLFTVFQTVFASLYEDRLNVLWEGNEQGDEGVAENLTDLAEHDYRVMEKDELDYEWAWDTCFFGRGLTLLNEFDRSEGVMAPIAESIDPLSFLRDPRASSVNGNMRGHGAMRFGGFEVGMTKAEMKDIPSFDKDKIDLLKKQGKDVKSVTEQARQERRAAQGLEHTTWQEESLKENYEYTILHWFTHIDGKKFLVSLGNDRKLILRKTEIKTPKWPIIDRSLFPMAHDWDGVSIPDLVEDKQRARAKMINLGLDAAIADLHPMYLYNKKKIRNKRDLDFAFNKAVGVSGDVSGAYEPMQKANTVSQQVQNIFNILDVAAQKAVAAPEIAQGIQPQEDRTLGESELVAAGRGARMSLAASIWGWSEKRFWRQWYYLYKTHFKEDIDEKIIRISGPLSYSWRPLRREDIIAHVDPDVYVESKRVSEALRQREFQKFSSFTQIAMQDPSANRRYAQRRLAKIIGLAKEDIFMLFPPTLDEVRAEDENEMLSENSMPRIQPFDDDAMHIQKHLEAADTPAKLMHIEAHKRMLVEKKQNPQAFEQFQEQQPEMGEFNPVGQGRGQQGGQQGRSSTEGVNQGNFRQDTEVQQQVA